MKMGKVLSMAVAGMMLMGMFTGCGSSSASGSSSESGSASKSESSSIGGDKDVLKVGMECAYAPFNWTQENAATPDGSEAQPIYGSNYYTYGYDVAVAKMLADELGMELEIHKVEWSSIGISMDSGEYDCIIAGMGRTAEREMAYSFTEPYYYRDNCIVVKKGGKYENVTKLSELAGTGCKATTQLGTGWIPLLDQIEGAETGSNYETTSECFMAVSNGVADVCIVDLPTAESALLTMMIWQLSSLMKVIPLQGMMKWSMYVLQQEKMIQLFVISFRGLWTLWDGMIRTKWMNLWRLFLHSSRQQNKGGMTQMKCRV